MPTLSEQIQARAARRLLSLPEPLLTRFAGAPKTYRGATLDPRIQLALKLAELLRPKLETLDPVRARVEQRALQSIFDLEETPVLEARGMRIAGVPVRVYRPRAGTLPALIYYHGGGFTIGDLDSYDHTCRRLAVSADCLVISVDYRLAPEHRFPAAVEDAFAVFEAVRTRDDLGLNIDRARIALGGDSAGGNLSAVLSQLARDRGLSLVLQVLIYPVTDVRGGSVSRRELDGAGYFLTGPLIEYFKSHYRAPDDDPRISPVLGRLEGVCPAFVVTCGFDPLRDEALVYCEKLAAAGVPVTHRCYETLIHGALAMAGYVPKARVMLEDIAAALRAAF